MAEYIGQKKPLGGLLFLLPRMFSSDNKDSVGEGDHTAVKELMKNILVELERLLVHADIRVSKNKYIFHRQHLHDSFSCYCPEL